MQINKVEICCVNTSELPVRKNNQMMELLLKIKELQVLTGATNETGFNKLSAR